jgi:hypothetical protein
MGNESTGTFVYAFSSAGVTVTRVDDMSLSASVELPGLESNDPTYHLVDGEGPVSADGEEGEPDEDEETSTSDS